MAKEKQMIAKVVLRQMVRGMYDLQKLRIQAENRLGSVEREGEISSEALMFLANHVQRLNNEEITILKDIKHLLKQFPIYSQWLKDIKGIGPTMAGLIISEYDIRKARYVSSFWRYTGLDVAQDGRGRGRRKEHLVSYKYEDKYGKEKERLGITFNPLVKTKMVGVLGPSFLKSKSPYAEIYYDHRNRLENHKSYGIANDAAQIARHKEEQKEQKKDGKFSPKLHRHNMAMRYMMKIFLQDLWTNWREVENLPVTSPYSEAKLKISHNG